MPKRFTLAEAQGLIPALNGLLREAVALKTEYDEAEREVQAFSERVMMMGGVSVDRERVLETRKRREARRPGGRSIEQIQELGCLIKDLDTGLVDFPTLFRGDEVVSVLEARRALHRVLARRGRGFRGRKPIDRDFLDHTKATPRNSRETEIKLLGWRDAASARRRLVAAGFRLLKRRVFEQNTVFDTPGLKLRKAASLLRVRRAGKSATLTYKGPPIPGPHKSRRGARGRCLRPGSPLRRFGTAGLPPHLALREVPHRIPLRGRRGYDR